MLLPAIRHKKAYENAIANKIIVWLWANIFQDTLTILKTSEIENDSNIIKEAILSGKIWYSDGAFYAKNKFGAKLAIELEKMGAKYSKRSKAYKILEKDLPIDIKFALDTAKVKVFSKAVAIQAYLDNRLSNINKIIDKLIFDETVNQILLDLQNRLYKNAEQHKIELITPKLDDFSRHEIARKYTENLNFWIKEWLPSDIVKMRETVGEMAIKGKSKIDIENYIVKQFGISQRKARFLARNETAIATSSYLSTKYENEGFTHFRWETILDGRERPLHKELNGKIFRFDNPPIIDERTGARGLPSQTYNCRCGFSPVLSKEFWENRRKMFKANNGLISRLKEFFK